MTLLDQQAVFLHCFDLEDFQGNKGHNSMIWKLATTIYCTEQAALRFPYAYLMHFVRQAVIFPIKKLTTHEGYCQGLMSIRVDNGPKM